MAYKPLYDWMDKQEGRKDSSYEAVQKEKKAQSHHASIMNVKGVVPSMTGQKYKVHAQTKKEIAKKMKPKSGLEEAIEARKAMLKRGDIGELLNYGAMRRRQKGGE